MIWIVCRGCGVERCIDETDGNDMSGAPAVKRGIDAFFAEHGACGHLELRDSYGRTYGMQAPAGGAS